MANNIIKYMGNNIGKSLCEENSDKLLKKFFHFQKLMIVK